MQLNMCSQQCESWLLAVLGVTAPVRAGVRIPQRVRLPQRWIAEIVIRLRGLRFQVLGLVNRSACSGKALVVLDRCTLQRSVGFSS
jgi:hypothetical protein